MRMFPTGPGGLNGFGSRAWVLRLAGSVLPVVVGVLEEDLIAQLFASKVPFFHDVLERGCGLEEPLLRLEVLLAVLLRLIRPEDNTRVAGHVEW